MSKIEKVNELRRKIGDLASFLNETSPLSNAHTVDFITKERWKLLDPDLGKDLLDLPRDQLNAILGNDFVTSDRRKKYPHLCQFLIRTRNFCSERLGICTDINRILPKFGTWQDSFESNAKNANWCVPEKKRHEVRNMAALISALNDIFPVDLVVDAGSGKGYLSSYVARFLGLDALGIEACEKKCCSALLRHAKMLERTEETQSNKKWKEFVSTTENIDRTSDLEKIIQRTIINKDCCKISEETGEGKDVTFTLALSERLEEEKRKSVLLCGLHTCGNLSGASIRQFVTCGSVKILCQVGCCYNLLTEEFCQEERAEGINSETGFPLSSFLREAKFSLGRNARLLASQCRERTLKNMDFHQPLFYRALLQVALTDYLGTTCQNVEIRVGRMAKSCPSFKVYVYKALGKLNLREINIDDDDVENYLRVYSDEEKKLKAFQLLRIILASCIETLILLDRLLYLWEQDCVEEAYLTRLFDSLISPRCYALIAIKKKSE
ncbi:methyltransferase-like protein 25 [Centruroides sculpturatus]|uniref:methyltransferase-like protein 25 n=1 Tax=Centruroides sculpturatus TaxID=218467 RepID=UPI000C6DE18C|nr:methyltransferase-like protein 25 [Centruroides sculpturatus]